MQLSDEALEYWKVCKDYRKSLSKAARTYVANITIPTLHMRATNLRIINQLSLIMSQEGVSHEENQPTDAGL